MGEVRTVVIFVNLTGQPISLKQVNHRLHPDRRDYFLGIDEKYQHFIFLT